MGSAKLSLVFIFPSIYAVVFLPLLLAAQTPAPQYVGSEACLACHEDVATTGVEGIDG